MGPLASLAACVSADPGPAGHLWWLGPAEPFRGLL